MALAMSESDMIWLLVRLLIILHYTTLHTLLHMHPHRHTHTHTLLNHNCTSPCLGWWVFGIMIVWLFWVILASCCCLVYVGCLGVYAVCRRRWTAGEALVISGAVYPLRR
jgi:hypothetical protein